jgi:hypothetical protein
MLNHAYFCRIRLETYGNLERRFNTAKVASGNQSEADAFFDGIRHCAEICDFSYCRLKDVLTNIANDAEYPRQLTTAAFVDAWSIVDAMHRFMSLWKLQPNATLTPPLSPALSIDQEFSDVVKVRNVADHLAQQADRIVKRMVTRSVS